MYGSNPAETAQIDQWLEFTNTQVQGFLGVINYAIFGYYPSTAERYEEAKKSLIEVLKIVDTHL
jgi:glutathione S-transferase